VGVIDAPTPRRHRARRAPLTRLLSRVGLVHIAHRFWRNRLTVLAYHRIADPTSASQSTLVSNVSATPAAFAAQMEYIRRCFDVISLADLRAWLHDGVPLPPYPALITFDDGYRDNLDQALPILRAKGLPAVLFLATDFVQRGAPFYWDVAAYCFRHTTLLQAELPVLGLCSWHDEAQRLDTLERWLAAAKRIPDRDRSAASTELPRVLAVSVPDNAFIGLPLSWDQIRTLQREGITIGAHTQTHAILTRISLADAAKEIKNSKKLIEAETGVAVNAFAYPNGGPEDFNDAHQPLLRKLGIELGFTLINGPQTLNAIRRNPLTISRIFIGHNDDLPRFAAKVSGLSRIRDLAERLGHLTESRASRESLAGSHDRYHDDHRFRRPP
jgi:peptidoglycan/xylan/chitin deacetylase (PgdA/CDA1 family)